MQSILTKSYDASGAIADHTIVKITADNTVAAGAAATDDLVGVSDAPGGVATTERVDVIHAGVADIAIAHVDRAQLREPRQRVKSIVRHGCAAKQDDL